MRFPWVLPLALLAAGGAAPAEAQTAYYARLGAAGASDLLRDVVVNEITVRQGIAPLLVLGGSLPLAAGGYRIGLEAGLSSGGFHSREAGAENDLGTLRALSLLAGLEGPILPDLRWRLGLGGLQYLPADDRGIFRSGGPLRFLAGAGLDYLHPVLPRWELMASARYDFHRFTTDELKRRGFGQTQGVSRVSLSVGLARSVR